MLDDDEMDGMVMNESQSEYECGDGDRVSVFHDDIMNDRYRIYFHIIYFLHY